MFIIKENIFKPQKNSKKLIDNTVVKWCSSSSLIFQNENSFVQSTEFVPMDKNDVF